MSAGPDFVRRRYSAVPVRVSGTIVVDESQYQTLDDFYFVTLNGGVDPFDWVDPRTGDAASLRFLAPPPDRDLSSKLMEISLSMEILP